MPPIAIIFRILAVLHTLFIFSLVPLGRPLQSYIENSRVFSQFFRNQSLHIALAAFTVLLAFLYARAVWQKHGPICFLQCTGVIALAATLLLMRGFSAWVEAAHIPIFALLAVLIRLSFSGKALLLPLLIALIIGATDEVLQALHPQRVFDFYDIGLNFISAIVGLTIIQPFLNREKVRT